MSMQFYSHLNFSVLTVDWAIPIEREKEWGRVPGGSSKHHFREMRQPSAMSADDSGPVIGKWQ
jgi:hypothetical protein